MPAASSYAARGPTVRHAMSTTAQPATTSSTQWLPVPTTTTAVTRACVQASAATARRRVTWVTARATHSAHPACMLGNAASWLVSQPRPWGADASPPHQPAAECTASRSVQPSISRGGAVGMAR